MNRNSLRRLYITIIRSEGTPESIGRAAAIGLIVGFILPVGFQTIPAVVLAFLFKANRALAWLFTCISNPATVLVIYPIQCYTGSLLILHPMKFDSLRHQFTAIGAALVEGEWQVSLDAFLHLSGEVLLTFFVGGLFYGILSGAAGYWICSRIVRFYRARKEKRRAERALAQKPPPPPSQD